MAYKGQRPKADDERVRRNKPVYDKMPLEWDGVVRGPALPNSYPWCDQAKKWWKAFRRSPQAMVCIDSDWFFLLDTALIYDKIWRDAEKISAAELRGLANEFRIRTSAYATTYDDRLKMRIEIRSDAHRAGIEDQVKKDAASAVDYLSMMNKEAAKRIE